MINLNDCTLIIPVRFDSVDRINNVRTVLNFIFKDFDTNIIICEHDSSSKIPDDFLKYEKVLPIFIETKDELFYKTKCINDMVKIIKTPYFAIYDADVLIPENQIVETINMLRERKADCVYPYDGAFLNVPKYYVGQLNRKLTLSCIDINSCKKGLGMPEITPDRQSFGGCVFFNKETFIKCGMANENMVSYGPEDGEIAVRFRTLTTMVRVNGPIFHMEHVRNLNSTENHNMAQHNHEEFNKILKMNKDQLLEYVNTWSWKNF